jgi:hypothetical protein
MADGFFRSDISPVLFRITYITSSGFAMDGIFTSLFWQFLEKIRPGPDLVDHEVLL